MSTNVVPTSAPTAKKGKGKIVAAGVLLLALLGSCHSHHSAGGGSYSPSSSYTDSGGSANLPYTSQDWNDICAGGAVCHGGLPNFVPGGGLSIDNP